MEVLETVKLLQDAAELSKTATETAQLAGQMQAALFQAQEIIRSMKAVIDLLCDENTRLAQDNLRLKLQGGWQ